MYTFDPSALPKSWVLDRSHEQGFRSYLVEKGHDETNPLHSWKASRALDQIQRELRTDLGLDYSDPYVVASYLVKYHLGHCSLAYWSFKGLLSRVGTLPSSIYVCDIGAGTGAGFIGLALALSELSESPTVHFDFFDTSDEMLNAGLHFLRYFIEYFPKVQQWSLRLFTEAPDELPDLPQNTFSVVTAFHLSLPYGNSSFNDLRTNGQSARRSLRSLVQQVSPDAGLFTCHEGKVQSLRQALDNADFRLDEVVIPSEDCGLEDRSHFYTDCAEELGFKIPGGPPSPVRTWSRYRFSLPEGMLLWHTRYQVEDEHQHREMVGTRRTSVRKSVTELMSQLYPGVANFEKDQHAKPTTSVPHQRPKATAPPVQKPVPIQAGDRVNVPGVGNGRVTQIRNAKAVGMLDSRIPCTCLVTELRRI